MVEFMTIILAFISILTFAYLVKYLSNQGSLHKLPHGTMGWPFIGETLKFLKPHRSNSLGSFLQERCSRYGRVFKSHLFGYPTIVSCDFELNMFILQNEGKLFPVDYPKVMHKILGKYALLLVTGELHKKLRSTVISFVSASKSESNFLHFVEMLALSRINSWGSNCKQVAFYKEAKRFSINVMLKHLLNINPDDPLAVKILENFENYIKGFITLPINIPGTTYSKAVKARIRLSSIINDIIIERRKVNIAGPVEGGDLLNLILSKQNLSDEEMVSIVMDLLFGGYETTSKLLSLIVYFLEGAPNALESLKEEHQVIRKSKLEGELLNWEDYRQMQFTQNVINEAMRCGNVVKYLHRKAVQDIKFKEFVIPAGWKVLPVLSASHLDPNLLENPLEFNPYRWNDENSTSKKVAPFGGGPRLCPGADLAKVEIAFFLHHLVLNYRWKMKANDNPIAFPYVEFKGGLLLDLEPTGTTLRKHS
ncbi:putative cholesterol monooxygenase (side-chain-cleaving) [Medicago truncatula]|uniref:Cytochrome P450 724B1 n=1 Tax=Medicago truncatula TaxID=3880 RepID=G7L6A3_MEDTR|nr:cytochrome P450 724B1 isoform X1 [Medicago truncatula]AES78542.1 cytochrome P450 family protein [Medicago truncatula]RHN45112.1 putative cholesterol monooxygenase (side-chain-cleaving) [Medicago truncatula]